MLHVGDGYKGFTQEAQRTVNFKILVYSSFRFGEAMRLKYFCRK